MQVHELVSSVLKDPIKLDRGCTHIHAQTHTSAPTDVTRFMNEGEMTDTF